MVQQDKSLRLLQQVTEGIDVGVCQLKALEVNLGANLVGQSGPLPEMYPSGEGQNQLSAGMVRGGTRSPTIRASSLIVVVHGGEGGSSPMSTLLGQVLGEEGSFVSIFLHPH